MGNYLSRGTSDVIFILFPFVLSAGLIIMIVVCWWKCKILVDHRRGSVQRSKDSCEGINMEEPDFGHLINIQEYAENQVGTTILYADSHPYVYFSDGRITRIVPLSPSSLAHALNQAQGEEEVPSVCNNVNTRNTNINNNEHLHLPSTSSSSIPHTQANEVEASQERNGNASRDN